MTQFTLGHLMHHEYEDYIKIIPMKFSFIVREGQTEVGVDDAG